MNTIGTYTLPPSWFPVLHLLTYTLNREILYFTLIS